MSEYYKFLNKHCSRIPWVMILGLVEHFGIDIREAGIIYQAWREQQ